jgi:hypothetical protein
MKRAFRCFSLAIIAAVMMMSAVLPVEGAPQSGEPGSIQGSGDAGGLGLFIGCDDVLSNRDIMISSSFVIDAKLFLDLKRACPPSRIGSKLSIETSGDARDAAVSALRVYVTRYIVSVSEGGKNVRNIPSNTKNWQYAIDPAYLEII